MENILIFGTGKRAEHVYNQIDYRKFCLLGFIDNDKEKQGKQFKDKPILSPSEIFHYNYDKILICSIAYQEILSQLIRIYYVPKDKIENHLYFSKCEFLDYYKNNTTDTEIQKILQWVQQNNLEVFNYPFQDKYDMLEVDLKRDPTNKLYYVMHNKKRMYFNRKFDERMAIHYYRFLLKEQDVFSPHRYLDEQFMIKQDGIFVDAGVAEGNFSLEIVERAKKIYLIESDPNWVEALTYTFSAYKDKVIIINKLLSDHCDASSITLDSLIGSEPIDFIKMDIEGMESCALNGAQNILMRNYPLKAAICCYHNRLDEKVISHQLTQCGMNVSTTNGFMVFMKDQNGPYRLTKGIVRGEKICSIL